VLCCVGLVAAVALAACADPGPVRIDAAELDTAARAACEAFLDDLPEELADEDARDVEPADALGAAYGDPAIVVTCVDRVPEGFNDIAPCEQVNDVGWFVPDEQVSDPDSDAVVTAMSHRPLVEVTVPPDYRPEGAAAVLVELSQPIVDNLELVDECL
jgi:hypothetical protein